jgi:hypothetical protein
MVWAIENNVELYNHTYTHADLSITDPAGIKYQLQENDITERNLLALVNRSDLDNKLGNIIALPFGNWPSSQDGINALENYVNPEGKSVAAVLEAYNADEPQLTPSIFSSKFNRMSIPRITSTVGSIQWVAAHKNDIPTATGCKLGPTSADDAKNASTLQTLITNAVQSQSCPNGVYHVNGFIFIAKDGTVTQFSSASVDTAQATSTPQQ